MRRMRQFMIDEPGVGAQFAIPYRHVVVNNSLLGLVRPAQRAVDMDLRVQLAVDDVNSPEVAGYGVDRTELEDLAEHGEDAPTAISTLD